MPVACPIRSGHPACPLRHRLGSRMHEQLLITLAPFFLNSIYWLYFVLYPSPEIRSLSAFNFICRCCSA